MKKTCKRCGIEKDISTEFYSNPKKSGNTECYCKQCCCEQSLERQRKLKSMCVKYKGGKCIKCGYSKSNVALEFHHRDPKQKEFSISRIRKFSVIELLPETKAELDKCDLVCSNCHKEIHEELNQSRWKTIRESPTTWIKLPQKRCEKCKIGIHQSSKSLCRKCLGIRRRGRKTKIDWPPVDWLLDQLKVKSCVGLGRELGVSDHAIRKRIKHHNASGVNRTPIVAP